MVHNLPVVGSEGQGTKRCRVIGRPRRRRVACQKALAR
jgi:hypothetical protein